MHTFDKGVPFRTYKDILQRGNKMTTQQKMAKRLEHALHERKHKNGKYAHKKGVPH